MTKTVAVISDVHGNFAALSAVINDARASRVDEFIFIGDYVFDLPFPNEVAELLARLENAHIIAGNKEIFLRGMENENQDDWVYDQMACVYQTFRDLTLENRAFLTSLPNEMVINICGVKILAIHYLPFFKPTPKHASSSSAYHKKMLKEPFTHAQYLADFGDFINSDGIRPHIENMGADVILFGHNHLQSHAYCGRKLVVNPGSCGQPLDFNSGASYTILDITADGVNVREKKVTYDIEAVIEQAKQTAMYEKGCIWMDLVFRALRNGRDYFGFLFETAHKVADSKGEKHWFFSNETWAETNRLFNLSYPRI